MASSGERCCSFKECRLGFIKLSDGRVEVKTTLPGNVSNKKSNFIVKWESRGDAVFHTDCWTTVVKSSRTRSKKKTTLTLSMLEKTLIKEAVKTAEFHDSQRSIEVEAKRIAELIKSPSTYCVTFTGAGISTSAGIGDYRGKSGKWTEQDRYVLQRNLIVLTPMYPTAPGRPVESKPTQQKHVQLPCHLAQAHSSSAT